VADLPAAPARRRRPSTTLLALAALVAGVALGTAASVTGAPALRAVVTALEPLGALWVNAIRMTIVPLVVSLLVTSVAGVSDIRAVGRLGGRALAWFAVLLTGVAVFAAVVAPPLFERLAIDPAAAAALRATASSATAAAGPPPELPTLRGFIVGLVPVNPIRAAADGAMLPLIVFTVAFAAAVTRLAAPSRAVITGFFRAASQAMLVVVGWILALAPIGVFALAADMGLQLGVGAAGAVGYYVLVLSAMLAAATLALYPVAALFGRTSLRRFAQAVAPAQAVAVGSRSSLASLPALIDGARRTYGDRPGITGFVLPLAVSTFKLNTPISDLAGPLFLAHLYGIDLSVAQVAVMTAISVAMSFSNPGIPSGGLFVVTAPVMLSAGMPLDGIGLLIAADAIPDVFATVINVTADQTVATVLARDVAAGVVVEPGLADVGASALAEERAADAAVERVVAG
jgi:Na+/H+-dicarboxylate symporter